MIVRTEKYLSYFHSDFFALMEKKIQNIMRRVLVTISTTIIY